MSVDPRCGKRIPGGSTGGHCVRCHENFRGAAFDRHLIRHSVKGHTVALECRDLVDGEESFWQDETIYRAWHWGQRDTRFA